VYTCEKQKNRNELWEVKIVECARYNINE